MNGRTVGTFRIVRYIANVVKRFHRAVLLGTSEIVGSKYNSLVPHVPYTVSCTTKKSSLVSSMFLGKKL